MNGVIQSFIDSPVALTSVTDSIRFQRDCIKTRACENWLCHREGSANYEIVEGGIYEIDFSGSVSSATAGVVALQLFDNGEPIPGTLMAETLAAANDYANLSVNKKIKVCCRGNSTISVRSVGAVPTPTTITPQVVTQIPIVVSANFSIKKVSC